MVSTDFDTERAYTEEQFVAQTISESERMKVVLGYFGPEQFIPVHAPDSDVTIAVQSETGVIREGSDEHTVESGDVVVVRAGTDRDVKTSDTQLEALLVRHHRHRMPNTILSEQGTVTVSSIRKQTTDRWIESLLSNEPLDDRNKCDPIAAASLYPL